jgi:hypothetical protein
MAECPVLILASETVPSARGECIEVSVVGDGAFVGVLRIHKEWQHKSQSHRLEDPGKTHAVMCWIESE